MKAHSFRLASQSRVAIAIVAIVLGTSLGSSRSAATPPNLRTVALSGTDGVFGPGLGAGVVFDSVDSPAMNLSGQVAFRGSTVAGSGLPNGVWIRPDATETSFNSNLALENGPQPGGGTYVGPNSYNSININNAGDTAFRLGASKGAFASNGGVMQRVVLAGDIAPGVGGATYSTSAITSGHPFFNNAGNIAFIGSLTTGTGTPPVSITAPNSNASAIFIGTGDNGAAPNPNLTPVARAGDWFASLGGTATDTKLNTFSNLTMSFNGNSRYVVLNTLQGSAVVTGTGAAGNSVALISNRSGSNEAIARIGNAAPDAGGAPSADVYRTFGAQAIGFNNLGHVAFNASLRQGATQTVASALFTDAGTGTLRRVGVAGGAIGNVYAMNDNTTPLPEFAGLTFGTSATFSTTLLNANDDLLFAANMSSGGQAFLKMDSAGLLHRVVRVGDNPHPGGLDPLSTGGACPSTFSSIGGISMNSSGNVAYVGNLSNSPCGVSAGFGNSQMLFATHTDGTTVKIARQGELFTYWDGTQLVTKTIAAISLNSSGGQDGRPGSFNDNGDLLFQLSFTAASGGGSGIFVAQVPEPGSLGLLALGALIAVRRGRRGA